MPFEFCGNENMLSILNNIIKSRKFSHSYLFFGDEGVGKKYICRQFAQGILCEGEDRPCGKCSSCRKIASQIHPDYFEIGVDVTAGKQGFSVDDARKLIESAYIMPNEGIFKIFLLNNVETLLAACANTLLKTLEEPPKHVIFLLLSNNKSGVLKTILSRCIPIGVYPVSNERCFDNVKLKFPNEDEKTLKLAANLSGGSIGQAIFYLKDPVGQKSVLISKKLLDSYFQRDELGFIQSTAPLIDDASLSFAVFKCALAGLKLKIDSELKLNKTPSKNFCQKLFKAFGCFEKAGEILTKNGNKNLTVSRLCAEIF